jgi:DNA-binding NarL/FixJ family response regulator
VTRILIVDDHEIVRRGVRALLESDPGFSICGEAGNGREAVTKATELRPDLVLLDVGLPELNGLEVTRQLRALLPSVRILVLTVFEADRMVEDLLEAGVNGYVLKSEAGLTLINAVHALARGSNYFTQRLGHTIDTSRTARTIVTRGVMKLTPREREVLQLLAEGKSNKEVGSALKISTKTAETHRARIMAKLGLHSMADVVRYAIRNHVIDT